MVEHDDHCPEKGDLRCDCDYEARARADERERIAQAIDAAKEDMVEHETWFVLSLAARIARSGGRDD